MTKIVEFRAENTRILKLVRIRPDGNLVIIGGDNEAGKTTVLDDIELIFSGAKSSKMPKVPIRTGESSASTSAVLSNGLTLTREWSATGTQLVVKGPDGKKLPGGPQAIADKFYSAVAFDPLEFADKMDAKKQAETLRRLVGLDFAAMDAERAALYQDREDGGRLLRQAEGQLAGMATPADGTPDDEVSITDLLAKKAEADKANAKAEALGRASADAYRAEERVKAALEVAEATVERLKGELRAAHLKAVEAATAAEQAEEVDTAPIVEKLNSAESVNRAVRAKRARAAKAAEVEAMRAERQSLTDKIDEIDADKARKLAAVKWPIDGLGFNSDGVTYKGLPFAQASKAARYKVSIAIGAKLHPELQVMLLRDASVLDKKSMELLAQVATEQDQQLWIERVGDGDAGAIVLVDGEVRATPPAAEESKPSPAAAPKSRLTIVQPEE